MKERGNTERLISMAAAGESLLKICDCAGIDGPAIQKLRQTVEEMQRTIKRTVN